MKGVLSLLSRHLRADSVRVLTERVEHGAHAGQIHPDTDCAAWARYLASLVRGVSIRARDRTSPEALLSAAIAVRSPDALRVDSPS